MDGYESSVEAEAREVVRKLLVTDPRAWSFVMKGYGGPDEKAWAKQERTLKAVKHLLREHEGFEFRTRVNATLNGDVWVEFVDVRYDDEVGGKLMRDHLSSLYPYAFDRD